MRSQVMLFWELTEAFAAVQSDIVPFTLIDGAEDGVGDGRVTALVTIPRASYMKYWYMISLVLMSYDVILICSYYSCLKAHDYFIIFFSSPHLTIWCVLHRSLAMTTEPSDVGGKMNE